MYHLFIYNEDRTVLTKYIRPDGKPGWRTWGAVKKYALNKGRFKRDQFQIIKE